MFNELKDLIKLGWAVVFTQKGGDITVTLRHPKTGAIREYRTASGLAAGEYKHGPERFLTRVMEELRVAVGGERCE